jgi:hypothetical protein
VTHIDPFAPGDSPQHPSHWPSTAQLAELPPGVVTDEIPDSLADLYQWRRDHLAMASEAGVDISPEELEARHGRYNEHLADYGSPDEQEEGAEFVAFPALLRRAHLAEVEAFEEEWEELFSLHATDSERDPMWVEGFLPGIDELRARADAVATSQDVQLPPAPKATALKEDWVEYALAVEKARGGELTFEQADAMTVADLKAAYKPQAD